MRTTLSRAGLVASIALAAGCSSGQSAMEPPVTQVHPGTYKAQLAVGVATFVDGSTGLNVVATFRQPDGLSGTLENTPTITGLAGFTVPAGAGGVDGGTNHITGSPQVPPADTPASTTLGESGGVFAYGLAPDNSDATGSSYNLIFDGAFYDSTGTLTGSYPNAMGTPVPVEFRGSAPSYPNVLNGTYYAGFLGFTQGFTEFDAAPVAGTYNLSIFIGEADSAGVTVSATPGKITSTTGSLGPIAAAPVFTEDGNGGGTATCTVPATAKETLVDIEDTTADTFFSKVVTGGGAITAAFGDSLGAVSGTATSPTLAAMDVYSVSCIAVNYPAFESGVPQNVQQLPTIVGPNGQADISFSPNLVQTYGGTSTAAGVRRGRAARH